MVILDVFGLPGSGKSYITHQLAEELRKQNLIVKEPSWYLDTVMRAPIRKLVKAFYASCYFLFHPKRNMKLLQTIRVSGSKQRSGFSMWINMAYTLWVMGLKRTNQVVIMDEGIMQGVISMFMYTSEPLIAEYVKRVRDLLEFPCVFFYVKVSVGKAVERLEARSNGKSRVDRMSHEEREWCLYDIEGMCETLAESFQPIYTYHNESDFVDISSVISYITGVNSQKGK